MRSARWFRSRDRIQPASHLAFRIALVEQRLRHPADGLPVEPSLRRFATPLLGSARQFLPGQLVGLALEAESGEQVRHVVLIAEIKVEAADLLHGARMKVVVKGPQLRQAGRQLGPG